MKICSGFGVDHKAGGLDKAKAMKERAIIRASTQSMFDPSPAELLAKQAQRDGRRRRGRRLVFGYEIEKIVDVKKPSWQVDCLFESINESPEEIEKKNHIDSESDDPGSNLSRSPPPAKLLPTLGPHIQIALRKYQSCQYYGHNQRDRCLLPQHEVEEFADVEKQSWQDYDVGDSSKESPAVVEEKGTNALIEKAIAYAESGTDVFSDEDKKDVAKYLSDDDWVFDIEIWYRKAVKRASLHLHGNVINLKIGEEELIDEPFSTRLEINTHKSPTIFFLKPSKAEPYLCSSNGSGCSRNKIVLAVKAFRSKAFLSIPDHKVFWTKPPSGYLKLNTAGIRFRNPDGVGMGNLIRDEWGEWLTGSWGRLEAKTDESYDRIEIRLMALMEGLSLAYKYNPAAKYVIESCSWIMVQLLVDDKSTGLTEEEICGYEELVMKCREGMEALPGCELRCINVEGNFTAVWLAQAAETVTTLKTGAKPPQSENLLWCLGRDRTVLPS